MKKNIFQIAIIALVAGLSLVSCQKVKDQDDKIETPVLVSISADKLFSAGSATVTATLTSETNRDVTVNLTTGSKLSKDFTELISDEFITLGSITIPAGQKEASTTVSVDYSSFEKGKYETQILVAGASGADVSSSSAANIVLLVGTSVATVRFDDYVDEYGQGTFTVSLDMFSETDCEVALSYVYASPAFVPEDAITLDEKVVIKAGETEATGYIAIDMDKLEDSGFWYVGVAISGINDGPFEASDKPTYSGLDFTLPVNMTDEWYVEYVDKEYYEGKYSEVYYQSGVTSKYFDYYVTSGDFGGDEISNGFVFTEFIAYENDYLAPYLGSYSPEDLAKYGVILDAAKNRYFSGKDKTPGEYKLWIVGLGEDGLCTGEYAVVDFKVEADTDVFASWLGKWVLGSTAEDEKPVVISINTAFQNEAYSIDGLEGLNTAKEGLTALGMIEEESGSLTLYSNAVYYGLPTLWYETKEGNVYADVLLGVNKDGEALPSSYGSPLGSIMFGADGNGYFNPGFDRSFNPIVAAKYFVINENREVVEEVSDTFTLINGEVLIPYVEPEEEETASVTNLVPRNGNNKLNPHRIERSVIEKIRAK